MKLKLCTTDIEVIENVFICCCKIRGEQIRTFEISARKFEYKEMIDFLRRHDIIVVGYNCSHYDTPILNMLISNYTELSRYRNYLIPTDAAFKLSNQIIGDGDPRVWSHWKWKNYFKQIDLMTLMASKALRVGLKSLQITMCYPNVQEMKVDWNRMLPTDKIDELIHYCHNDVNSTEHLSKLLNNDIDLRMKIQKEFKVKCLSKDGVGIGVDIFTNRICKQLGLRDEGDLFSMRRNLDRIVVKELIPDIVKFKTPECQKVLDFYKEMILDEEGLKRVDGNRHPDDTSMVITLNNLQHSFGIGGVHSINKPMIHEEDDKYVIIDADVASLYPSLAIIFKYGPAGFKEAFLQVLMDLRADRITAKKAKEKLKDTTYKLALNSILGNLRNMYSPYYAPEANTGICVSGQLLLLMLIEECELNGIECISSNTDGITVKCPREKVDLFYKICDTWQERTKLELEYAEYEKLVIVAVNDYIAYKKGYKQLQEYFDSPDKAIEFNFTYPLLDGDSRTLEKNKYIKEKGMFITNPRLGKGLDALIVPKALIEYYGKGTPIEETIRKSTNIWDFVKFQKIGKQYEVVWKNEKQQHINRFYVSKSGGYLFKRKVTTKFDKKSGKMIDVVSDQNVLKGFGVELFNTFEQQPMDTYKIDYRYYINACNKIINLLEPKQMTLF